jgi:hypothetical protein
MMQAYPISDPMGRPQAEEEAHLVWSNSNLECSVGRWFMTHSFVEMEDRELSGYVFDDSLLLVAFVEEKGNGAS